MHATATCLQHAFDPVERCFPLCSRSNTFSEREQVESRPAAAQAAMAFCARHSRNVDFAIVDCASPLHRLDQWQKEILSCIRPEDWHDGPTGMEEYLENDDTCQHIAQFTLETRFGERWFRFLARCARRKAHCSERAGTPVTLRPWCIACSQLIPPAFVPPLLCSAEQTSVPKHCISRS